MSVEEKKILRKEIRALKRALPEEHRIEKSKQVMEQVEKHPGFIKAEVVLLYYSMDDEVHTHDFVEKWHKDKMILLPVVKGDELELKVYRGKDSLTPGDQFGIPEPTGEVFSNFSDIDFMIIPGVAFDKDGRRMGRGRGFYDRLLALNDCYKVGVCFDFQMKKNIPVEAHDIAMNEVFCD